MAVIEHTQPDGGILLTRLKTEHTERRTKRHLETIFLINW